MTNERTPRWKERLAMFKTALDRLTEVVVLSRQHPLSEYEQDSLIKRFEFTYETGWKLMMSYEKENGILQILGSRDVVRHACNLSIVEDGEAWMDMIDARNRSAHVYDAEMATDMADDIIHTFYPLLSELYAKMEQAQ